MLAFPRALALCLLAGPAAAAVLTVGPSGQFAEISDAIAAAQPDDVILVEPGSYQRIVVTQPLRILGDGTGDVIVASSGDNGIVVSGIAAGGEVVLSGLDVRANPFFASPVASIHVVDCAGTVILHDVEVEAQFNYVAIRAERSARVMLLSSEIPAGGPPAAVQAVDSELWIADSDVIAMAPAGGFVEAGYDGVQLEDSTLRVWRSTIHGSDAATGKPAFGFTPDGGDGIDATGSMVFLYGGAVGDVLGGDGETQPFFFPTGDGGVGVRLAAGSEATIQSSLSIVGGFDGTGAVQAPPVAVDGTSGFALDPSVFPVLVPGAAQTAIGGAFALSFEGSPGGFAALFVSPGTGPTLAIPGVLGVGVLDAAAFVQLATTTLDASGGATIPLVVPPIPALLGAAFVFQGAELLGGQIGITSPALVSVTQ